MSVWILAALAIAAIGGLVYWKFFRRKIPIAGGRGPVRFPRSAFEANNPKKTAKKSSSFNFRALALWIAVLVLVSWLGFSLASRSGGQPPQPIVEAKLEDAPQTAERPAERRLAPTISGSLAGPPPTGPIPKGPTAPEPTPTPAPAPAAAPAPVAAPTSQEPRPLFPPTEEPNRQSPMINGAQSMAPVISRMETLGRALEAPPPKNPDSAKAKRGTAPTANVKAKPRIAISPRPNNEALANNIAPDSGDETTATNQTLTAPPKTPDKWTVLIGAFGVQENAFGLKSRMEAAGYPVAISEVVKKNKLWYRLQSGVFDDKVSAEAYGRELRQRKLVDRPYVKPL